MGGGLNNGTGAYLEAGGARWALLASLPGEALRHGGKETVRNQSQPFPAPCPWEALEVFPFIVFLLITYFPLWPDTKLALKVTYWFEVPDSEE